MENKTCKTCINFISFKSLFNNSNEPDDRGICLINPKYIHSTVEFMIVSLDYRCKNHISKEDRNESK